MSTRKHKLRDKTVDPRFEYLYAESSDDDENERKILI